MSQFITVLPWDTNFLKIAEFGRNVIDPIDTEKHWNRTKEAQLVVGHWAQEEPPPGVKLPLKLDRFLLSCLRANSVGKIHRDGLNRYCALNIPVANCEMGMMQWFDNNYEMTVQQYTRTVVRSIHGDTFDPTLPSTYQTLITQPSLVNTDVWHRIDNSQNSFDRYILTFRFKDNPTYEDMKSLLATWLAAKQDSNGIR
jgi:hypothetical protein